jgi:alcohol dehydrogenase class IV
MDFNFYSPVKLVFGQPTADSLPVALDEIRNESGPDAGAQRVLLISDAGLRDVGLVDEITLVLRENRWDVTVFTDVRSNPTTQDVEAGLEIARRENVHALVAVGGGSVIDVAKGIGLLMTNGGSYADYQWRGRPIERPILPLVALPTTSGTGSEVTKVAVIADEETHFKKGVLSPQMFCRAAIVDPALTLSLPARLTATTGADALVHALEAFVGRRANPASDALALAALTRAWRFLPRATHCGEDVEAREGMALASTLAGLAFDQSGLGIIHSLAGPLAERYDLHHGLCTGLLLPYGLGFNLPALGEKRDVLLRVLQLPDIASNEEVVEHLKGWLRELGLPLTLSELGIKDPDLAALAEEASRMVLLPNNPRPATTGDCQKVLEQLL